MRQAEVRGKNERVAALRVEMAQVATVRLNLHAHEQFWYLGALWKAASTLDGAYWFSRHRVARVQRGSFEVTSRRQAMSTTRIISTAAYSDWLITHVAAAGERCHDEEDEVA
jgi:hypothetical protein